MRFSLVFVLIVAGSFELGFTAVCDAQPTDLLAARRLRLTGRYEEAFEKYAKDKVSPAQVLGLARCLAATGKTDESILRLTDYLEHHPATRQLNAQLAEYYFNQGKLELARQNIAAALKADLQSIHAQFLDAELQRVVGDTERANEIYERLSNLPTTNLSSEQAIWIGRAKIMHGRLNRDTNVFDQLVNGFYPALLEKDKDFWPAYLESGKLFLEKYNDSDAARELNAALAINPRAAEVHVQLGRLALRNFEIEKAIASVERALKINPRLLSALQLMADIAFTNLQPGNAFEPLQQARSINPIDEGTLGRLLAVYMRRDGFDSLNDVDSRASQLVKRVTERNAQCGRFFAATAEAFNDLRYYPLASDYYKQALKRSPQLDSVRGALGMVQMRLGEEVDARRTLDESFKVDPFNVRVKNTLDVLDLLDTYAVLETEHFIIRFDRGNDGVLAEYAARFLEDEVYPDIVAALGYEPQDKTLLEIFSKSQGTSGHSWFSARMVGLPFIGTVGACAGKMFALTSPGDGKPYNWARVLRHEFVHVVNLQQTNFLIPHWFTEAIAVRNEMVGYPADWDRILAKYVAEEKLFDLTNINHGFVRPGSSERWTLAYFQSYLYSDFILQLGGENALIQMLEHYANGKSTGEAIKLVTGKSTSEFEKAYREFLGERTKQFGTSQLDMPESSIDDLLDELQQSPKDSALLAKLAAAYATRGQTRKAREYANSALAISPKQPMANFVMARLLASIGEDDESWEFIETGLDDERPDSKLLAFAANLKLANKEYEQAAEFYRQGQKAFPHDFSWTRGLARVLLASNNELELMKVLAAIADREADKTPFARKLTLLALKRKDFAAAEKWANRVLHVDVMNPVAHAQLARALAEQDRNEEAIREYKTALKLLPTEPRWKQQLMQLKQNAKQNAE